MLDEISGPGPVGTLQRSLPDFAMSRALSRPSSVEM